MRRFTAKIVLSPLVTAWRFAGWPTSPSPSLAKATIDGVVRAPSTFSITLGLPPSITATQLLVVPRSIPITFAMVPRRPLIQIKPKPGPQKRRPEAFPDCDIGARPLAARFERI